MKQKPELVVIGGSWGGIQASLAILKQLPPDYSIPVVLVLHRLRSQDGSLESIYEKKIALPAVEIEDKQPVVAGFLYLAPVNYHVLLEKDKTFSLDVSDLENYSRPSIDVTFMSAADAFGSGVVGVLLSGASKDGSAGLKYIAQKGGTTLVQDPQEAEVSTMPLAAIQILPECDIFTLQQISGFLLSLHDY